MRRFGVAALVLVAAFTVSAEGCEDPPPPTTVPVTTSPTTSPATTTPTTGANGLRNIPDPLYGVTFDNANGASTATLNAQVATLTGLPHFPTTRLVFDENQPPSGYVNAVNKLYPVTFIMGELLDSSYVDTISVSEYTQRAQQYLAALPKVDIWEVGNEVNGNWLGDPADVAAKVVAAYNVFNDAGKRTALTLWENNFGTNRCGNGSGEETPQQFLARLPAAVRNGLDYVTVSWYPTLCKGKTNGNNVPLQQIGNEMVALHTWTPNAKLGFGELGLPTAANTSAKVATATGLINYYYPLDVPLAYYIKGFFWWYGAQDVVPTSKPLFPVLRDAMED